MTTQSTETYGAPLIDHLLRLAATVDKLPESRAALAELRRGLDDPLRIARHVAPYLPEGRVQEDREAWLYIIAALFAWHRQYEKGVSLGAAFRRIKDDSGSIESRFLALLSSRSSHLEPHLRHAVRLLASRNIGLDWHRLANDVVHWEDEGKRKQHQLARDFYSIMNKATATDTENPDADGGLNP